MSSGYLSNYDAFQRGVAESMPTMVWEQSATSIDKSAALPPVASAVAVGADATGGLVPPPPPDNMGVEITGAKVDWLSFTIPAKDGIDLMGVVAEWSSKLGGAVVLERGRYGYPSARAVLGTGVILWNNERLEMGVHVELTSKALATYAAATDNNLYSILLDAMGQGAKFKRIDICSDNYTLHISTVIKAMEQGNVVTRSRDISLMQKYKRSDKVCYPEGATLYIGSPTSDRRVRFYDKAAEQGLAGTVWTRAEVQLRDDLAHQTVIALLSPSGTDLEQVISSAVDFRLQDDVNTTRRTRCDWWEVWVGHFKRFHYMVARKISLVGDAAEWVQNQVAPTLAYLFEAMGYDFAASWLIYQIESARNRIPAYRLSHLAAM